MSSQPTVVKTSNEGIITALSAFFIWGTFPLYFKQLAEYNPVEIIAHRIIWTFVFLLLFIVFSRRFSWITVFKKDPKWLLVTIVSGVIIGGNWLTYVWAVNNDQLLAASLGYFLAPLVGIGLSLVVFKEKLRQMQWLAIAFAVFAVVAQVLMIGELPWVSLLLAATFGVYGMIQKQTPLLAIDALFVEAVVLIPLVLLWLAQAGVASSVPSFWISKEVGILMLAGPITIIPLLLFNKSTKMVAYSVISFMNYLTPSFVFLLAVFYYHEPFNHHQLIVFGLIWVGLMVFSVDLWRHRPSKLIQKTS